MNPTTPAAIIAPNPVAQPSILEQWRSETHHSSFQHGVYAVLRMLFHASKSKDEHYLESEELVQRTLKKLVRTYSPIRRQSKIVNGQKPFGELMWVLNSLKSGNWKTNLTVTDEDREKIRVLASSLHVEARLRGNEGLYQLAAPVPPPREKKPYVRPQA